MFYRLHSYLAEKIAMLGQHEELHNSELGHNIEN